MARFNPGPRRIKKPVNMDDFSLTLLTVIMIAIVAIVLITAIYGIIFAISNPLALLPDLNNGGASGSSEYPFRQDIELPLPEFKEGNNEISGINSTNAVIYDVTDNEIVAYKKSQTIIYPASLTKVMTLIVVYENLPSEESLNDVLTINMPLGEHSGYGFVMGEKLTVKDLIYAAVLQSDGVACITLAEYIAGSETKFVQMMNAKARELGLSEKTTLFQNCTGLHHQYHYSTAYDMAVITAYAMKNTFCANVLTSLSYKPGENFRPGETHTFWHGFLHGRLNDGAIQPTNATIKGGKTGWTGKDSGYCITSFAQGKNGHTYVVVTAKAESWATAVDDTVNIYKNYID